MSRLAEALVKLQQIFPGIRQVATLRDETNTIYGYEIQTPSGGYSIFGFKGSMNGNEASIHEDMLFKAERERKAIILMVKDTPYRLLAADIRKKCHPNLWHGVTMINFPLYETGENLLAAKKPKPIEPSPSLFDAAKTNPAADRIIKDFDVQEKKENQDET